MGLVINSRGWGQPVPYSRSDTSRKMYCMGFSTDKFLSFKEKDSWARLQPCPHDPVSMDKW